METPTNPDGNDSSRPQRHCLEVTDGNRTHCAEIHLFRFKGRWNVTAYGPEGEPIEFFTDEAGFVVATDFTESLESALERGKKYVLGYLTDSRWRLTGKAWKRDQMLRASSASTSTTC